MEKIIDFLTFEAFKSEGYLIINKTLIKTLGLLPTILLSNYIDKYLYFCREYPENEGWFYQTHKQQIEQLNIGEDVIRKNKQILIKKGILITERRGIPAKEWLKIHPVVLSTFVFNNRNSRGQDLGKSEVYT